jgi:hypothetical protein
MSQWEPFEVTIRVKGRMFTWIRYAPDVAHLLLTVTKVIADEWPAGNAALIGFKRQKGAQ